MADGQHSVPTELTIATDSGSATVHLPPMANGPVAGVGGRCAALLPAPSTGQNIRITVDAVAAEDTLDYYSQTPIDHAHRHRQDRDSRRLGAAASCHHPVLVPR